MRLLLILAAGTIVLSAAALPARAAEAAGSPLGQPHQAQPHQAQFHQTQFHQTDAISAAKRNKKRQRGHQAYGRSGQQIACTHLGCSPIPRGCRIETGRIPFTWEPSGFDDVVCPYR